MKAIVIEKFGNESQLKQLEVTKPVPSESEVLIKIAYSGVNPVDWKIREGYFKDALPHHFPVILGWEAAGTVEAVGKNVRLVSKGDRVYTYCRKSDVQWGTYAEYVSVDEQQVARIPSHVGFAQAAGTPLTGLTAWQALDQAKLRKGETILIHAGAGGVGSFAIQFAKLRGAKVVTTASQRNHGYVKELGADEVIDYREQNFVSALKGLAPAGVDVVLDAVGGPVEIDSAQVLKKGGRLVSIVNRGSFSPEVLARKDLQTAFLFVEPSGKQLQEIAKLYDSKALIPPPVQEFRLTGEDVAKAHKQSQSGHTQGKIVLKVS